MINANGNAQSNRLASFFDDMSTTMHNVEMRMLGRNNANNNNEAIPLNPQTRPLPSTHLLDTFDFNGATCRIAEYYVWLACCNQSIGQGLVELCTDNEMLVGGLLSSELDCANFIGTLIGCGALSAGVAVDNLARRTENPTLRMAGMAASDVCTTSGTVIMLTPASTIIGAATLKLPLSTAALTTSTMAWLACLPISIPTACCVYKICCKPKPEHIHLATTTRLAQYSAVNAERVARQQQGAAVMGGAEPPHYHSDTHYNNINH